MDHRRNPYAPGAGSHPPELAGRDSVLEDVAIGLDRVREGLDAKSALLVGLRGVGKTVLLNRIADDAETRGIARVQLEAVENRSLPSMLAPPLRRALLTLDRLESAKAHLLRAWRGLAGARPPGPPERLAAARQRADRRVHGDVAGGGAHRQQRRGRGLGGVARATALRAPMSMLRAGPPRVMCVTRSTPWPGRLGGGGGGNGPGRSPSGHPMARLSAPCSSPNSFSMASTLRAPA